MIQKLDLKLVGDGLKVGRVFGKRLLVKLVKPHTIMDKAKASGLSIPESAEKEHEAMPTCGIVIAHGEELLETVPVVNGATSTVQPVDSAPKLYDMIMFSRWSGTDVQIENENFRIIHLNEIICTLEPVELGSPVVEKNI